MYLHKINDNIYVNIDLITEIYWHNKNNSWCYEVAGRECPTLITEDEKNNLVADMLR